MNSYSTNTHAPTYYYISQVLSRSLVRQQASTEDFCLDTLNDSRRDLRRAINQWRIRYRERFPQVFPHTPTDFPEDETLELPSSYNTNHNQQFGLDTLAQLEYEIRLGHAYDTIDDLRTAIHVHNASNHEKRTQVFGQRPSTRARVVLNSLKQDIRECAKRYRLSYSALVALGLPKDSELKPIGESELWGKDMTSMSKLGDSKHKEPWYWVIGKPRDVSDGAWEQERMYPPYNIPSSTYFYLVERVRWFRTRAARDRCTEELEILDEEFRRTHHSFTRMDVIWMAIGKDQFALRSDNDRLASGYCAYACRQAALYTKLADNTAKHWRDARSCALNGPNGASI